MNHVFRAGTARFILGTGVAVLIQVSDVRAQGAAENSPEPALPGEEIRLIEPVEVQPLAEPAPETVQPVDYVPLPQAGENSPASAPEETSLPVEKPQRRWRLLLGVAVSAVYDDNIFLKVDNEDSDFIFTLSPSIGVSYGDPNRNYLSFVYTPTFVFFAEHSEENAIEHAIDLTFRRKTDRWLLESNLAFRVLTRGDGGEEEQTGERVGERADRRVYAAALRAKYAFSGKTSLEAGVTFNYTDYDEFLDTLDIVNQNYIDYLATGKTTLGLGFGIGYAKSEGGPEQVYEQALLRVTYTPTSKITLKASGGAEFRQVDGSGNQVNGIFGLGVAYAPFEHTSVAVDAYRRVRPSSVAAEANYVVTGVTASVRQRFLRKFYATLRGGYENTEYESLSSDADFLREEDYFFIRPSVEFRFRERAQVELFYEYRSNKSAFGDANFANNRIGVQVGFTF